MTLWTESLSCSKAIYCVGHQIKMHRITTRTVSAEVVYSQACFNMRRHWPNGPRVEQSVSQSVLPLIANTAVKITQRLSCPNPTWRAVPTDSGINSNPPKEGNNLFQWKMVYGKMIGSHSLNHLSDWIRVAQSCKRLCDPSRILT